MILAKASLAVLGGVSLCMANISGIVTDTGITPVPGVVVQLEKGGQKDTTKANGSFTLFIGTTGTFPGEKATLSPNGVSAIICGTTLNMTLAERSAVEVGTFDLGGTALSTVRMTLDAGIHSIKLPYRGTGIYLYKVKSGNREFVLRGNPVSGVSSGISVSPQGLPSKPLAKQTLVTAAINDVIAATKAGYLNYRCVQYNSDTAGVRIKMIPSAGTVKDTDGNVYQTVRIGSLVWMVENLRVTKYRDGSPIPLDTSAASWTDATTPKFCFYQNTTNSDSIRKYGALYNWYVVSPSNPKKIAPAGGWYVPLVWNWDTLQNYLTSKGYNWDGTTTGNKLGKSLAAKTDWVTYSGLGAIGKDLTKNNSSGFSALPSGTCNNRLVFNAQGRQGGWWCSWPENSASIAGTRWLVNETATLGSGAIPKSCGYSVRLVRNY